MQDCEQFTGRLKRICEGTADLPLSKINAYRAKLNLPPLTVDQHRPKREVKSVVVKSSQPRQRPRLNGYGPGSQLIKIFSAKGMPACQACYDLAEKMDTWGNTGCEQHFDEIVADILPRAKQWLKSNRKWVQALLSGVGIEDAALKQSIGHYVRKAIKQAKDSPPKVAKPKRNDSEHQRQFVPWKNVPELVAARSDPDRQRRVTELLAETEILVKSFMRQDSLLRFVQSVRRFYPDVPIRVADDSPSLTEHGRKVQQTPGVTWHSMPHDQGLPAGRNLCVQKSSAKYVILCDDDYFFTEETDLASLLLPLEKTNLDLCGGLVRDDTGQLKNWCGMLRFDGQGHNRQVVMSPTTSSLEEIEGVRFCRIDVTYNFFAAKRSLLLNYPWDERYIIAQEHLDSFLTWSQAGAKMAYTIDCVCGHSHKFNTPQYRQLRGRTKNSVFNAKWGVSGHKARSVTRFAEQ